MMAELPPISREQAFLETYFQCISQFAYDKAREQCEREREMYRPNPSSVWGQMINCLIQLAISEKTYTSLMFLGQKWFQVGRKDTLRNSYSILLSDLRKIEDFSNRVEMSSSSSSRGSDYALDSMLEKLVAHLCGQLAHYLTARTKTMDFYEQMATMGTNRNMNFDDLLNVIVDIIQAHQRNFHHPILAPLKNSFSLECEVVQHLLQAQLEMSLYQFLNSLLHLNDANTKLASWSALVPQKETKKLGFGSSKSSNIPALYQWLIRYKTMLVSKFSLYFYEVLCKQAPPGEMKNLLSKASVDFYSRIVTFHKKSDAASVSLVFDSTGLQGFQKGSGYHHPNKFTEPPKGLDSFPALFSYPLERPERHWPSVISIITDKTAELSTIDRHVYFCDEKLSSTYFLSRIEPRITLVLIFENKKAEKDSYVNSFLIDITTQLRCSKLFASLRPGSKG